MRNFSVLPAMRRVSAWCCAVLLTSLVAPAAMLRDAETVRGDIDGNGVVDIGDINIIAGNIITLTPASEASLCDLNVDGVIDIDDLNIAVNIVLDKPTPPDGRTYTVGGVTFTMVDIEGGTFVMGATEEQVAYAEGDEYAAHEVTLSDYSMGLTEVTQALWEVVMGSNPSRFVGDDQRPVERVSWDDAMLFIEHLNAATGATFRLPTEAEWEYAARGGNKSRGYLFSGSDVLDEVAWYYDNSWAMGSGSPDYGPHAVASKAPNELGLYDMSGNVWEWCSDYYGGIYSDAPVVDPTGSPTGYYHIMRGGSSSDGFRACRVSYRGNGGPTMALSTYGLRLAM